MRNKWGRLALACLIVVGGAVAAAGGSAGNRTATVTFAAFPGPGSVTYEQNIAYTSTLQNTGASTFTQVEFHQRIPVATFGGSDYPATLVAATCSAVVTGGEAVCGFVNTPSGSPPVTVTFVWRVPTIPSQTGCTDCLTTQGRWLIKEGKPTNGNEEFATDVVNASLLGDDTTAERLNAGGFQIDACGDPTGAGSLHTNRSVNLTDPVSTTFCIPSVVPTAAGIGYASTITEFAGNARRSDVCIAAFGQNCVSGYLPADFSPNVVTFVFRVAQDALPKNYRITQVFHNGVLLTAATCATNGECVQSIDLDRKTGVWTIVTTARTNGSWTW